MDKRSGQHPPRMQNEGFGCQGKEAERSCGRATAGDADAAPRAEVCASMGAVRSAKQNRRELARAYKERTVVGGVWGIQNAHTGKWLLGADANLSGAENKFSFFGNTGVCPYLELAQDWKQYGKDAFRFEVLEELEKKPEQSPREFQHDLKVLLELWRDKIGGENLL